MRVEHYVGADGRGRCPVCDADVDGEPGSLVSYWHPVEDCRDVLATRLRDMQRQLRDARVTQ
jgi:hypothetical protein